MNKNIILIGFMGTGKTTIGKRLARALKREFVDTDEDIQYVTGMSIPQIFSKLGEIRFRSEEHLAVRRAISKQGRIIATGGGVLLDESNFQVLKDNGLLILLKTKPETIHARIARKGNRPLLGKNVTLDKIKQLLEEREAIYSSAADYVIQTDEYEYEEVVKQIIKMLKLDNEANYEELES